MVELVRDLDPDRVRANLQEVQAAVGDGVEVLCAVKYVHPDDLEALAEAGVTLLGENRSDQLAEKAGGPHGARFTWDFIGALQSRKVKDVLPHVRLTHSVASLSVLKQLEKHGGPDTEVLVEVDVAGEEGKAGIPPAELDAFLERCPVRVSGLMTMPPLVQDPEDNRRHFAALAQLAADRGLTRLSMGTTQDHVVAAQEGATIVRVGTRLFR